jgi:hypothetical protein
MDLGYEYKQLDVGKGRSLGKTPKKQDKTPIKPSSGPTKKPFRIVDVTNQEEGMGFIFSGRDGPPEKDAGEESDT